MYAVMLSLPKHDFYLNRLRQAQTDMKNHKPTPKFVPRNP